jgi:hypothetical protein
MGFFLLATVSRPVLRPTQPPVQDVSKALNPGVKRQGCEADHSLPYSAEVKNVWSYTSIPQYVFTAFQSYCLSPERLVVENF